MRSVDLQKGFAPILILVVLLVLGIGLVVYLSQRTQIFSPQASDANTCTVTDPASLRSCFARASVDESLQQIEITKQIVCSSKEECEVSIKKRTNPLLIFGTPNSTAGIKRIQNYDYPLLLFGEWDKTKEINDVNKITLKDLVFDETTASCDFITQGVGKCNSPLVFASRVNDTVVDHITILHAKAHGMQVQNATRLTLKNSIIFDSEGDGLWFDSAYTAAGCTIDFYNYTPCAIDEARVNRGITIENNLFADNRISAIEFYAYPDGTTPSRIKGNLITHNHRDSKYKYCPPPDGHCPGGQLAVTRSKSVIVEENVIRDGHINTIDPVKGITYEQQGLLASGIELADSIQDITIKNNKIYDNGTALFADYVGEKYKVNGVNIIWNMVHTNKYSFVGSGIWNLDTSGSYGFSFGNNIIDNPSYPVTYNKAFIFSDPPVCESAAGSDKCETTVRWYSNDFSELKVTLKENPGSLFASGLNGTQKAPWILSSGATFELRNSADNSVLAETRSLNSNTPPQSPPSQQPSPSALPSPSASPSQAPVVGVPTGPSPVHLSAAPNPCILRDSEMCATKISWTFNQGEARDINNLTIKVKENPDALFASLTYDVNGTQAAPWIRATGATFQVFEGNVLREELFVRGVQQNMMAADPNPCILDATGNCTSKISWNFENNDSANAYGVKITVKENPGSLFASGIKGTQDAPWIKSTGATFEAYAGSTLLATLFVKGIDSGQTPKTGDLNNDGKVDIFDFNIFLQDYRDNNLRSDLNKNGKVDIFDFNLLLANLAL